VCVVCASARRSDAPFCHSPNAEGHPADCATLWRSTLRSTLRLLLPHSPRLDSSTRCGSLQNLPLSPRWRSTIHTAPTKMRLRRCRSGGIVLPVPVLLRSLRSLCSVCSLRSLRYTSTTAAPRAPHLTAARLSRTARARVSGGPILCGSAPRALLHDRRTRG